MMTDDSGEYDARKLRSERRAQMSVPISWSIVIAGLGAAVTWGMMNQRLTDIEGQQRQWETIRREQEAHMASQDTEIAVVKSQYAEIIRRLDEIQVKIERGDQVGRR